MKTSRGEIPTPFEIRINKAQEIVDLKKKLTDQTRYPECERCGKAVIESEAPGNQVLKVGIIEYLVCQSCMGELEGYLDIWFNTVKKKAFTEVILHSLYNVSHETLYNIVIDYELIDKQERIYNKEELITIVCDEVFAPTQSIEDAVKILKEYNINLEVV